VIEALQQVVADEPRLAYAILFGSAGRDALNPHSDVDIAVGIVDREPYGVLAFGTLVSRLEAAAGRPVHLVLLNEAAPALAYRVFRDGRPLTIHDQRVLQLDFVRSVLGYLDFRPVEAMLTAGVLRSPDGR
jgi:predicted nucleotidyltransferase